MVQCNHMSLSKQKGDLFADDGILYVEHLKELKLELIIIRTNY